MKKIFTLLLTAISATALAQNAYYSARLEAVVQKSPAQVQLKWEMPPAKTNGNITIYRKTQSGTSWGAAIAQVAGGSTSYNDNNVAAGSAYEYLVVKDDTTNPHGYIFAGIEQPAIHSRGALILVVDDAFSTTCSTEIATLVKDLSGDGWEVIRKDYPRTATVATVKAFIVSTAQTNSNVEAVYILGHIAVPYSGDLNPDAHPDHKGAWPADLYYGDLDGTWADGSINNSSSGNPLNHNTPGDGKFDNSYIPSDIDLQVGRVDFYDMPAFSKTEEQLMKSYLNKAHQYKTGALAVNKRALVDDNFKTMPEGFAGNGWRNFAPLVGINNVEEKDLISTLNTTFYQWAYGCGGGSYTSCGGVGTTANIAANDMNAIFTPVFGSYFGDWNYKNNFLRAPLCADVPSLASFWAGRPNWYMHHMALGENIGYSTRLSQNNNGTFYATPIPSLARTVTTALMGDPSLRTEYVKPVPSITLGGDSTKGVVVSWTASPEAGVAGYYVYRSISEFGEYKLRSGRVTGTTYTDSFGAPGTYWYMVRATKLQTTPSGTYYNMSLGTSASGTFQYPFFDVGIPVIESVAEVQLYPNPAQESVQLVITGAENTSAAVTIADMQGKAVYTTTMQLGIGKNIHQIDISTMAAGMYMVQVQAGNSRKTLKLVRTY